MNLAGATVDQLIDGDPEAVGQVEAIWSAIGQVSADTAVECGRVDPESWTGTAANGYRSRVSELAVTLRQVSETLGSAVNLAAEWRQAVEEARMAASAGLDTYAHGLDQRRYWLQQRDMFEAATGTELPDVSADTIAAAERQVQAAQETLDARAVQIAGRMHSLADQAVAHLPWTSDVGHILGEVGGGAAGAVADTWDFFKTYMPIRFLIDPDGATDDLESMRTNLVTMGQQAVDDPFGFIDDLVDDVVNGFAANPARGVGEMIPDAAATAAGVAAARRSAGALKRWIDSLTGPDRIILQAFARSYLEMIEARHGAHFVARHGPHTTRLQQLLRAMSGILPNGRQSYRTHATRFLDWQRMEDAIRQGLAHHRSTGETEFLITFDHLIGEGYQRGSSTLMTTRTVAFMFESDGTLVKAFPDIKSRR